MYTMYVCVYIYIHIYTYICNMYIYVYMYVCMCDEDEESCVSPHTQPVLADTCTCSYTHVYTHAQDQIKERFFRLALSENRVAPSAVVGYAKYLIQLDKENEVRATTGITACV